MKISIDVTPSFPEVILCKFHLSRIFRLNVALLRMNLLYFVIILRNFRYFPFPIVLQRVLTTKNVTIHGVTLWLITRQITMITMAPALIKGCRYVPIWLDNTIMLWASHWPMLNALNSSGSDQTVLCIIETKTMPFILIIHGKVNLYSYWTLL